MESPFLPLESYFDRIFCAQSSKLPYFSTLIISLLHLFSIRILFIFPSPHTTNKILPDFKPLRKGNKCHTLIANLLDSIVAFVLSFLEGNWPETVKYRKRTKQNANSKMRNKILFCMNVKRRIQFLGRSPHSSCATFIAGDL